VCIAARTSNDIKPRRHAKVESFNGDFISGCAGGLLLIKILKFEFTLKYAEAVDIRKY